jgi:uncharacterized protein (DUF58 family)
MRALAQRHAVLAVQITDPREFMLPAIGLVSLVDPETGALLEVNTSSRSLRERYSAAAVKRHATVIQTLRRCRADVLTLRTDHDWLLEIVRHVAAARRRRGLSQ